MTDTDRFEHAFVAMSVLVGSKAPVEGLATAGRAAAKTALALGGKARNERAAALARALVPLAAAVDARRLG